MIRLPWVATRTVQRERERLADEVAHLRSELQAAHQRAHELALQLAEIAKPPKPEPPASFAIEPARELPKELRRAIDDVTPPNSKERRAVEAEVWALTDKGLPDSEIETMVRYGQEVDL